MKKELLWQTPKTNWQPADFFDLDPDYARIRQNILFLANEGASLGVTLSRPPLPETVQGVPGPDFFDRVEKAIPELYRPLGSVCPTGRQFQPGDAVWDSRDLARIETALRAAKLEYNIIKKAQPVLAFTLGGDFFEP